MSLIVALKSILGPRLYRIHQTNNSSVCITTVVSILADLGRVKMRGGAGLPVM